MEKKEYFVKVDTKDELPTETNYYAACCVGYQCPTMIAYDKTSGWITELESQTVTHWLKPISSMPEQEWVSDKEIEKEFPIEKNNEAIVNHYNLHSQIGAKWMRDKLLNK